MHFWIDKRSQTCGFGRARVAASLGGGGVGLGFGPPSRRIISKPPSSATIHRQQSNTDASSRSHISNNNHNNCSNNSNNNNNNLGTPIITNNLNTTNNNPNRNNRNRSNHSNSSSPYQQHRHHLQQQQQQQQQAQQQQQSHHYSSHENNHQNRYSQQHQYHQRYQSNNPMDHHSPHNLPRAPVQLLTVNNQDYHLPVALPYNYGGPSHALDLEQGSLGIETVSVRAGNVTLNHHIGPTASEGHGLAEVSTEPQLLPPHLKFGMCASLVLASVFIAGAKYYFDHQGGSMDALIFCAFLTISFLALCAISLCRYVPRDITASPSISVDGHSRILDGHMQSNHSRGGLDGNSIVGGQNSGSPHPQIYSQNSDQLGHDMQMSHSPGSNSTAPPPPYHIAILLPPESGKDLQSDESPPPSYDKILI